MRLTHVELSVPAGTLTPDFEADVDRLLHDVFGWTGRTAVGHHPTLGPTTERTYAMTEHVRLVLREAAAPLAPGTEDHFGFQVEPGRIDDLAARCAALASVDDRIELRYIEDGRASAIEMGDTVFRTFFVRHLIPLWFQFEAWEAS
ncbi:MAG: hypothetical protein ACJ786_01985 [Catenulispora sp.]